MIMSVGYMHGWAPQGAIPTDIRDGHPRLLCLHQTVVRHPVNQQHVRVVSSQLVAAQPGWC